MPTLTYTAPGAKSPVSVEIYKELTTLGRSAENDIVIADPLLLEEHAMLQFDGEKFSIQTLNRKHPLSINGRSRKSAKLKHNDQLELGATRMVFRMFAERPERPEVDAETSRQEAYSRLFEFSRVLMKEHDLSTLLNSLIDEVINITRAERGFLILMEGNEPRVAVGRNVQKESLADPMALFSDSIVAKAVKTRKPLILSDALSDDQFGSSVSVVNLQLSSVMCVPMLERGRLLGVIYVGNSNIASLFDRTGLELLMTFAAQAALIVQNALLLNEMELNNQKLAEQLQQLQVSEIIGASEGIRDILNKLRKVAGTDVSVLVQGETGTGKELIARELHRMSNRSEGPFVTINCGAIPENLLESELFGHVKGAFTGAVSNKEGKFQAADGGTIFLDEIGEMPLQMQVKLLRVLQEKVVTRIGENRPRSVDIRIVAATNRILREEAKQGRFREDLYFRLNVISFTLPPLRERGDDIILLARYFLQKFAREYDRPIQGFTPGATIAMKKSRWAGNIRELENRLRKAVILAEGTHIDTQDMDLDEEKFSRILPLNEAKEQFQSKYINDILELNNGNRTKTARDLNVDPRTIFRHLEKEQERLQNEKSSDF
jgi:transcriptional regulator with GAF, ATPase, and Fis domain